MNQLTPDAFRQASRDADTKMTVTSGAPQALLTWFLRRGWKIKFLLAGILMFLIYGVTVTILEATGIRSGPDGDRAKCAALPNDQKTACIIAAEDKAAALAMAEHKRQEAEESKIEAKQKAEDDEVLRQRNLARAKPMKVAFDKRLMEIVSANPPLKDFTANQKLADELRFQVFQLMRLSDHPLNKLPLAYNPRSMADVAATSAEYRTAPQGRGEASAALLKACKNPYVRTTCAEGIKSHILDVAFYSASNYIDLVVQNTR